MEGLAERLSVPPPSSEPAVVVDITFLTIWHSCRYRRSEGLVDRLVPLPGSRCTSSTTI